jgi:hypothetical protein
MTGPQLSVLSSFILQYAFKKEKREKKFMAHLVEFWVGCQASEYMMSITHQCTHSET